MSVAAYQVGDKKLRECDPDPNDPRGLLWVWREPEPRAEYIVACDPTMGISNWNRTLRTKDDRDTDNAAIQVIRKGGSLLGGSRAPDEQVAEFAAPIHPFDLPPLLDFIGKLYAGASEEGAALCCIEVYPGPGWQVQQDLISKFGYPSLPPWLVVGKGGVMQPTGKLGWYSNRSTRIDLWTRGTAVLSKRGVVLRSPWLIEEMADCTPDSFMAMTGRAGKGLHDDRVVALLIGLWFANEWTVGMEPTERGTLENAQPKNPQAMAWADDGRAMTSGRLEEEWNARVAELGDE